MQAALSSGAWVSRRSMYLSAWNRGMQADGFTGVSGQERSDDPQNYPDPRSGADALGRVKALAACNARLAAKMRG